MAASRETNGERLIRDSASALLPAFPFWLVVIIYTSRVLVEGKIIIDVFEI